MLTPGHSPGGQSVVVDTDDGTFVIAGMCTIRDNFYPPRECYVEGHLQGDPGRDAHGSDPLLRLDAPDSRRRQGQRLAVPRRRRYSSAGRSAEAARFRLPRSRTSSRRRSSCSRASAATRRRSPGARAWGRFSTSGLPRPAVLVDLNRIGGLDRAGGGRRGARDRSARLATAASSATRSSREPALCSPRRLRRIGHVAIRNRGTFGGSLAHADPAAELPAAVAALDGELELRSGSRFAPRPRRRTSFVMPFETAVEEGELVVGVHVPPLPARTGQVWLELNERHGDFALVGVAVSVTLRRGRRHRSEARLAYAGVGPGPWSPREAARCCPGSGPARRSRTPRPRRPPRAASRPRTRTARPPIAVGSCGC